MNRLLKLLLLTACGLLLGAGLGWLGRCAGGT